jgi:hypothetical protein
MSLKQRTPLHQDPDVLIIGGGLVGLVNRFAQLSRLRLK